MNQKYILVADVGGSHITVGSFQENSDKFYLDQLEREEVDSKGPKNHILKSWAESFKKLNSFSENVKIGIAFPAPFDYEKGICLIEEQGKFNNLFGVNIKKALADELNILPSQIAFINDAKAFLVGESYFGIGKGYKDILGLTLGSGLGSSLKKDGKICDAGLWSSPFKDGIAEDYLGTGWFVKWVQKHLGTKIRGVKELVDNPKFNNKRDLVFDIFSRNLADFIEVQVIDHQIELVIIGGNITNSHHMFLNQTLGLLKKKGLQVEVKISELGEKSALMGAAVSNLNQEQLEGLSAV